MKIINLSDFDTSWNWLKDEFPESGPWVHFTTANSRMRRDIPLRNQIVGLAAAIPAVLSAVKADGAILVSHGPRPTFYGATAARLFNTRVPHLACSFNFTDLPQGKNRKIMASSYRQVRRFLTYSTVERRLYSEHFGIPLEKIDMVHWSVHPPKIDWGTEPIETGDYLCALGSQGRDYETLFTAIEKLPYIRLVVVTNRHSIKGLKIPKNVTVHIEISRERTMNILQHSRFMVLPLRDNSVPCGHVTIVSGMFYRKAIIITDSIGIYDYIRDGDTGLFYEARNPADLRMKIEMLWTLPGCTLNLTENAYTFAQQHCSYVNIASYFANFITGLAAD